VYPVGFFFDITFRGALMFMWGGMIPIGLLCVAFHWLMVRGSERDGSEP